MEDNGGVRFGCSVCYGNVFDGPYGGTVLMLSLQAQKLVDKEGCKLTNILIFKLTVRQRTSRASKS